MQTRLCVASGRKPGLRLAEVCTPSRATRYEPTRVAGTPGPK